jgi:hypothetical protein
VPAQIVPDAPDAALRVLLAVGDDLLLENRALLAYGDGRGPATQSVDAPVTVLLKPGCDR